MAVKVEWTKQAIDDIYQLSEYVALGSERYAKALIDNMFKKAEILEIFPVVGRVVPEISKEDIRELIYKSYRIVYRIVDESKIDVIAVHHSARNLSEESLFG